MARIAEGDYGVATRHELLAAGISDREIGWRLRTGALIEEYPGTYRVGHRAPSTEATYMAAVKATGDGALLAGLAGAYHWRIIKGPPPPPQVISLTERRVPGIITHRARRQPGADAAVHRGIPVTSVARTLVDLAGVLGTNALAEACHEAGVKWNATPADVEAVLKRRPTSKGARKLRRILHGEFRVALSRLERGFLKHVRAAKLPLPVTNKPKGSYRVDCRWPEHELTVELDSYRFHNSRRSWEKDRHREREARARGDDFRRYTWDDVFVHPALMMRELKAFFEGERPG
jgi:very-short-patch-repair endonuclease